MALLALIIYTRVHIVRPFVCANCVRVYRRSGFDCEWRCTSQITILMIANCQVGNILLIAYSFSCDSFDCELWKNSQFAIKESRNQNPTYGIRSSVRTRAHIYICACTCIRVSLRLFTCKNANAVS